MVADRTDADAAPTTRVDLGAVFDASPNAYMVLDRDLRYVAANRAYLEVTHSTLDALLGRGVFDVFPDDENARLVRGSIERAIATRATNVLPLVRYRMRRTLPDGTAVDEHRFWSASHVPLLDARGEVAHVLQHTVDVTELHRLEAEAAQARLALGDRHSPVGQGILGRARAAQEANALLSAERDMLRSLFEQAPGFVCFLRGPEHVYELANESYFAMVGHRPLIGKTVRAALPEVEGQGFFERLDQVYATGAPFVGRGVPVVVERVLGAGPEELFIDFVYQPILDAAGAVAGIFVSGHDTTVQRRAEAERASLLERERTERARAELAEKEHRFLAEAIPQQVWTSDADGRLDFVNGRVAEYFGLSRETILGDGWQNVIHPDDLHSVLPAWTTSLRTGAHYEVEFRLRRADGTWRWHLGRALPLRDAAGAIRRWYGTNTDIDEARRARDELQARTEFEQQLIGIVSHDLRNPLAAIGLTASLLLRRGGLDGNQGQLVARIVSLGARATRLIRDFLDFSQARSRGVIPIDPGPADLQAIARQVVDEVHVANADRAAHVEHHGPTAGRWDADRLAQAIGNLVANAFQHSPPGETVRVTTRIDDDRARIDVHNGGPPIPDADRARLFAPFQRGQHASSGTAGGAAGNVARSVGLGLYIARAIVAAHGGSIDVDSAEGRGTTFTIRLPREVTG